MNVTAGVSPARKQCSLRIACLTAEDGCRYRLHSIADPTPSAAADFAGLAFFIKKVETHAQFTVSQSREGPRTRRKASVQGKLPGRSHMLLWYEVFPGQSNT